MSVSYGFIIKLDALFSRTNIEKIISQGHQNELVYLEPENMNNEVHDLNNVVKKIFYNRDHPEETDVYGTELMYQSLEVRYKDIWMSILFNEEDGGLLTIHIWPSNCTRWTVPIDGCETDVYKYARLIYKFLEGFKIIEFYSYTNDYQEYLTISNSFIISFAYGFKAELSTNFTKENIYKIVQSGENLGLYSYKDFWKIEFFEVHEIVEKILYINENRDLADSFHIEMKCDDIWLRLFFYQNEKEQVEVFMASAGINWKEIINKENKYYLKKDAGLKLIMDLLKDFEILKLEFYADNEIETIIP